MTPIRTPANRTRWDSDGNKIEITELVRVGEAGWKWTIRSTSPTGNVEEWTRRTSGRGRGLWEGEHQLLGTSQFSLPSDRSKAIRRLLSYRER